MNCSSAGSSRTTGGKGKSQGECTAVLLILACHVRQAAHERARERERTAELLVVGFTACGRQQRNECTYVRLAALYLRTMITIHHLVISALT